MPRRTLPLLAVVPALVVAVAHAQDGAAQRQPAFRADVSLVEVAAVVTGADGRSIADLTADDFEVVEDGVVRPITSVRLLSADGHDRRASVPSRAGTATDTASDVERLATNAASADAPAFVLLLDDLDTSRRDSHRVIRAAETALSSIPESALVSVLTTSGLGGALLTLEPPGPMHIRRIRAFRGQLLVRALPPGGVSPRPTPAPMGGDCMSSLPSLERQDPTRAARRASAVVAASEILERAGSAARCWSG